MKTKDYEKIGRQIVALSKSPHGVRINRDGITDAGCDCCVDIRTYTAEVTPETLEEYAVKVAEWEREQRKIARDEKRRSKAWQKKMEDPEFAAKVRREAEEARKRFLDDMESTLGSVFSSAFAAKWKEPTA